MNTKQYIKSRFEKILSETIGEKTESILNKLNYDKEAPFNKPGESFDYVQEEGDEMCEQCGRKDEVMELGGMDTDHPKFGKLNLSQLSKKEIEKLLDDEEDEDDDWEEIDLDYETDWEDLWKNYMVDKKN